MPWLIFVGMKVMQHKACADTCLYTNNVKQTRKFSDSSFHCKLLHTLSELVMIISELFPEGQKGICTYLLSFSLCIYSFQYNGIIIKVFFYQVNS